MPDWPCNMESGWAVHYGRLNIKFKAMCQHLVQNQFISDAFLHNSREIRTATYFSGTQMFGIHGRRWTQFLEGLEQREPHQPPQKIIPTGTGHCQINAFGAYRSTVGTNANLPIETSRANALVPFFFCLQAVGSCNLVLFIHYSKMRIFFPASA